jgi:L-cysteine S-thiosulfotransferase
MRYWMTAALTLTAASWALATPEQDRLALLQQVESRFPNVERQDHINGAYALDAAKREQWIAMEDFPPYEFTIEDGETLWYESFSNQKSYSDCFGDSTAIKQHYPRWDEATAEVVTLDLAINQCREANGEEPLDYMGEEMAALTAFIAYESRDELIDIEVPDQPEALAAYEAGKAFYYQRRGQLNFSCSSCHIDTAGNLLRAERLSSTYGHVTHWPAYRLKWSAVGPLHKRFMECNDQVKAKAFEPQSAEYRNLEYFMSYMSQGLPLNGPSTRK